jgi:hypothetical protein
MYASNNNINGKRGMNETFISKYLHRIGFAAIRPNLPFLSQTARSGGTIRDLAFNSEFDDITPPTMEYLTDSQFNRQVSNRPQTSKPILHSIGKF